MYKFQYVTGQYVQLTNKQTFTLKLESVLKKKYTKFRLYSSMMIWNPRKLCDIVKS